MEPSQNDSSSEVDSDEESGSDVEREPEGLSQVLAKKPSDYYITNNVFHINLFITQKTSVS